MFCRFWGVSACACNFLLRNSGSSENSCVLTILRCIYMLVQLSSQKQQTYEFSRGNPFPRRWSSEYSYVPMILRCIYMLVQLSSQKQRIYESSYLRVVLQWTNWYLLTVVRCIFVRVKLFSLETVGVRILAKFSYLRATLQWKMGYLLTVVRCICVCV